MQPQKGAETRMGQHVVQGDTLMCPCLCGDVQALSKIVKPLNQLNPVKPHVGFLVHICKWL